MVASWMDVYFVTVNIKVETRETLEREQTESANVSGAVRKVLL